MASTTKGKEPVSSTSRNGSTPTSARSAARESYSGSSASDSDSDSDDEEPDEEGDEAWEDWKADDDDEDDRRQGGMGVTRSLFSREGRMLPTPEEALEFDRREYGVDVVGIAARLGLDFHQIIRLINYIRQTNASPEEIKALDADALCLMDDSFLAPVIPDDPLLQLDIEEMAEAYIPSTSSAPAGTSSSAANGSTSSVSAAAQIRELQESLAAAQDALLVQREAMAKQFQDRFQLSSDSSSADSSPAGLKGKEVKRDDDTHYFASYSYSEIHSIMLKDRVRTESYMNFILNNPTIFKGAVVMDVGCGTGILSMFAAKAGAKRVIAVDASDIVHKAERNVKENGLQDVVMVVKGKVEEISEEIVGGKVDVIISEWMGYFLLYESMLDSVLVARDRFLRPGGLLVPSQCSILLSAVSSPSFTSSEISFWDDVYGFKMSCMKEGIEKEAEITVLPQSEVVSTTCGIRDILINKETLKDVEGFKSEFELRIITPGQSKVHGFFGWFDTFFTINNRAIPSLSLDTNDGALDQPGEVQFTTGPQGTPTHWKQTLFLLQDGGIDVQEGDVLKGSFGCKKRKEENSRELEVEMVWRKEGEKHDRMQVWTVC